MAKGALWFLLAWLSGAVFPRVRARPAEVRKHQELRPKLRLDQPYYLAQVEKRRVLIPKDRYLAEVEALLQEVAGAES